MAYVYELFYTKENAMDSAHTKFSKMFMILFQELISHSIFFTFLRVYLTDNFLFVCLLSDIALGPMDGRKYFNVSGL